MRALGATITRYPARWSLRPRSSPSPKGPERSVESSNSLVGLGADQHTGGADAENVTRAVVLPLVDVIVADALETTGTRRCKKFLVQGGESRPQLICLTPTAPTVLPTVAAWISSSRHSGSGALSS